MTESLELYASLEGQVAFVSGANRGIGAEITSQLLELGATVYAGAREIDSFDDRKRDRHIAVSLDVTDEESIIDAIDEIRETHGSLDVLVNNAGILRGSAKDLIEQPTGDIDEVFGTNIRGPTLMAKHTLPLLLENEGSRVVNLSSGMGALNETMSGGSPAYRISKTALNGLTRYLDSEYPRIIANSVCPGWVRTDMGGPNASRNVEKGAETPVWLARFKQGPSGRFWRDKEVIEW